MAGRAGADRAAQSVAAVTAAVTAVTVAAVTVAATGVATLAAGGPAGHRLLVAAVLIAAVAGASLAIWAAGRAERARLIRVLEDRLAIAERQQREFLADLAHEITTPLSSVAGLALSLLDGTTCSPADRAEAGLLISSESARIHRLVEAFRDLSRLDVADSCRREALDLGRVVSDVVRRAKPAARAKGLRLLWSYTPVSAYTDQRLVETVVGNFLSNALRYTPPGGEVRVRVASRPGADVVSVADTGIGIETGDQARVFDRMFRVDRARSRATGGSGLGLAIARSAADALGGRIELESVPGQGSEFRLVLVSTVGPDPVSI